MALSPGTQVGPYEILEPLGAGGMGEVYRARDARLGRDVALKSLPEGLEGDPSRVGRFEREARLLASLHHANVATLYGLEEVEGSRYLILECVEGETLAERLARGALPVEEAMDVCRQIAAGLEAAHEHGIVHRDLKPANVKITPSGEVKVLDFGLAKVAPGEASADVLSSPTLSQAGTAAGVILGTAPFMSPEQARGKPVDRRSDVWSFGCVLFECLTGRLAFEGETVSDVIGRILQTEPAWDALPAATPPRARELLRRCLTRDPQRRLRDIGEARIALEETLGGRGDILAPSAAPEGTARPRRERLWMALAVVSLLSSAGLAILHLRTASPPPPRLRATIPLPPGQRLDGVGAPVVALSRDGRTLAFVARGETGPQQLFVRELDEAEAVLVPGSETAEGPFFSPDGRWVAFAVGVSLIGGSPPELRKYSLETRLTQTVCALDDFFGGVWREDDTILFVGAQPRGLRTVDAAGGSSRPLIETFRDGGEDALRSLAWPEPLPGGRHVLVDNWDAPGRARIVAVDLESREVTDLGLTGWGARHLPTGHLAYGGVDGTLMAVRFDAATLRVTGTPVALAPDVAIARNDSPAFAVSEDGTLVHATGYLQGSRREPMRIVQARPGGERGELPVEADLYGRSLSVSPDGRSLALSTWDESIWLVDLARGTRTKLPAKGSPSFLSLGWTPDGSRIAFPGGVRGLSGFGIFAVSLDGSGEIETLVPPAPAELEVAGWSPDRSTLFYLSRTFDRGSTFVRLEQGSPPVVVLEEAGGVRSARVSPDGAYLAFDSEASGDFEVYVYPLSKGGQRLTVTSGGGHNPVWSPDGRELLFGRGQRVLAVAVRTTGGGIDFGPERTLVEWNSTGAFALAPDGAIYSLEPVPGAAVQTSLHLQTSWFSDLERLAGR